ncbi:MAG: hypothetical protein V1701_01650 [Planctomycetota bacterium]
MKSSRRLYISAFSLIELLVAIGIFSFLVTLLAALLTSGLGIWQDSEGKGDSAVRAQLVLEQVQKDLASAFSNKENKVFAINAFCADGFPNYVYYPEPNFCCRRNTTSNKQLVYVTCQDNSFSGATSLSYRYGRSIKRIVYGTGDGSDANNLIRAVIDQNTAIAFWQADLGAAQDLSTLFNTPTPSVKSIFEGVAYLGFQFLPPSQGGQEPRFSEWDSREGDLFENLRNGILQPQTGTQMVITQTLPCTIELEVIVRPAGAPKLMLYTDIGAADTEIKLNQTRPLIGPPGYIKIDNEWMSFDRKENFTVRISQRGLKNTVSSGHQRGAEVIYGELFKVTFLIK